MLMDWMKLYMMAAGDDGAASGASDEDRGDDLDIDDDEKDGEKDEGGEGGEGKDADKDEGGEGKDADKDEGDDKDRGIMVPKSRLDAKARMLEEERKRTAELERKLREAEGDASAEKLSKLDELDEKIAAARKDGDTKEEVRLLREQRALEREIGEERAANAAARAEQAAVQKVRLENTIDAIERAYPELNPDADEFDADMSAEALTRYNKNLRAGDDPVTAMKDAVEHVVLKNRLEPSDMRGDKSDKSDKGDGKRKTDVSKNLDAHRRTPPRQRGESGDKAGITGTEIDPAKLSEKQFAKMSEEEKSRMRGDIV